MGVVSVTVQSMGLTLVAEQACVGGELQLSIHAGGNLAAVWLQVRVQIFTIRWLVSIILNLKSMIKNDLLIRALLGGWGVAAGFLSVGKWAVVFPIIVSWHGVVRMVPGVLHFNAFLSLTKGLSRRQWLKKLLVLFDLRLWGSGLQCWSPGLFGWSDGSAHDYVRIQYSKKGIEI